MLTNKPPTDVKALVVEDEPALNLAYVTILKAQKYNVDTSFDGEEALVKAGDSRPDVILLDLRMPKLDGIEFLRRFSKLDPKHHTKIIVFSNYDEQKAISDVIGLGADRYMLKAEATPKNLIQLINEVLVA